VPKKEVMAVFNESPEDKWSTVSCIFVFLCLAVQTLWMLSIEIVKAKKKLDLQVVL
jgi:hypothetical protein